MKNRFGIEKKRMMIFAFVMFTFIYSLITVSGSAEEASGTAEAAVESGELPPEAGEGNTGITAPVNFADERQLVEVQQIHLSFPGVTEEKLEWDFPYSDEFFGIPSDEFSITMARGSMGLTLSAFRTDNETLSYQYETYLKEAGFTNIFSFGYDKPPTEDSLSGVIGMKRIGDATVIAAAACGQGYGSEWSNNFKIGSGERHEGFSQAAGLFEDYLAGYLKNNGIEGKKKLWISGFSRASAVGNILAADMIDSGEYDDVYAYLFGVPRTTRQPVRYKGIYNICGQYDPVPSLPLQSWGYERYGTDLYTPAQESNSDYTESALCAKEVGLRLDGKGFRNNPEVNYQLRLIIECLGEFLPDSGAYCMQLQDLLTDAFSHRDGADIHELLTTALNGVKLESSQDQAKINTLIDYLGYIVGQHLRADQRQVEDGSWDSDEALIANLALEHLPVTYIRWLFSEAAPEKIFSHSVTSRRISVIGKVDVTVLKDGREITRIDKKGRVSYPLEESSEETSHGHGIFMMRNENITVISLPNDAEYYVKIDTHRRSTISFYDLIISPEVLADEGGTINLGMMSAGSYGFVAAPNAKLPSSPDEITGIYMPLGSSDYDYSPTAVINDELEATKYYFMSMKRIYGLIMNVVLGLVLFLLACLIMYLVHRHKVKKGHPPYSKWYVITPHLIVIVNLTVLTALLAYHLFVIDMVRTICGSFVVLSVFLLSLRGTLRYRRKSSIMLTSFLFFCFVITFLFFKRTVHLPFSWFSVAAFALATGIFSAAAVHTFREPTEEKSSAGS